MKKKGFTIPEVLVMVMILSIATGVFIKWQTYRNTLLISRTYADQTKAYTNVFIGYLRKNKKNILASISPGSPIVVSWNDLLSQGYVPTGFGAKNLYNQNPCLLITQNTGSNLLYPMMVYMDGNNVDQTVTTRSMILLGGFAAIYNRTADSITGGYGLWSYNGFAGTYQGSLNHCGSRPSDGALAVNIGMMNDFNDAITPDVSLQRLTDKYKGLGESFNTNTAFTDITLTKNGSTSSGKVYLNHNSNVYFSQDSISDPSVTLKNASLTADVLQPTTKNNPGLVCSASQLGSVSSQVDGSSGMQSSVLVCTYNPPVCQAQAGSDYCFSPIKHNTIKYTNTGYMGSTFYCPAGAPIVSDAQPNSSNVTLNYRNCPGTGAFKFDCNKGSTSTFNSPSTVAAQFLSSQINVSGQAFNMQVGYRVTGSAQDLNSCDKRCSALSMSVPNSGTQSMIQNATCACTSGSILTSNFVAYDVFSVTPAVSPTIKYVTCTSKMVLTQQ